MELGIGNATLSTPDTVTAVSLDNTGQIRLLGSSANQALLDVTGSAGFGAAGVLSGHVRLSGDSAIEFASGEITSLAADAQLTANGNDAFIEEHGAREEQRADRAGFDRRRGLSFDLENGASVSTTVGLVNNGHVLLEQTVDGGRPDRGGRADQQRHSLHR